MIQARPAKLKVVFVTWLGLYPLITLLTLVLSPVLKSLPPLLAPLLLTGIAVPLMEFLVMPFMTRIFKFWLHHPKDHP